MVSRIRGGKNEIDRAREAGETKVLPFPRHAMQDKVRQRLGESTPIKPF